MAFPSIRSQNTTNGTTASATPVINLPATVVAGDILVVFIRVAVAGAIGWPDATWIELFDASPDGADDQIAMAWKVATGSEGGTTITLSSGNGKFCSFSYSIKDGAGAITPPELSTVATGTSPNQPDATTCTPTGGAKDYLWVTFFGMEGEQTGITTYPTNYTLGQTGLANSGTAGVTSTNCTAAAAARQNNASSENAGVWAVAGTLINWSAYTLAIHPAPPIGSEVSNTLPPRFAKPSLGSDGLTVVNNLLETTLAPIEPIPNSQLDWPNPAHKPYIIVGVSTKPPNDANIAFNQLGWPNPTLKIKSALTWLNDNQNNVLVPIEAAPFSQNDWPNPQVKDVKDRTFIFPAQIQLEGTSVSPFIPIDAPNPKIGAKQNLGFSINLLESTLAPAFVQPPFNVPVSIVPDRKPYIITSFSSFINIEPGAKPPTNIVDLNPSIKFKPTPTWIQGRQIYYQDIKPFKQDDYPNPAGLRKVPPIWIQSRRIPDIVQDPFIPVIYPNPIAKGLQTQGWIFLAPFQQIFTHPVGNSDFTLPAPKSRPQPLIWIQPRPSYYNEPVLLPFTTAQWQRQDRKIPQIHTILNKFQLTSIVEAPFRQSEWPIPLVKIRPRELYEFFYTIDDNLPPAAIVTALPTSRKRTGPSSWIYGIQIQETNPIRAFDYPNPILVKEQNHGYIYNLLESTLNPGAQDVPFNQTDYPNPQVGKRNSHQGIQDTRKFYFTEPSLQIAQYDWPVFRPISRNHVGFISFRIGTSEPPKFFSVIEVPSRRARSAETWLYSSLIDLNSIIGLRPFSQNDWPIPTRGRTNYNILTILGQDYIILPNVVGREICLVSSITEYYLISSINEYDLESGITEYNLNSGGDECQ